MWSINNKLKLDDLPYHYTWYDMFQELLTNDTRTKLIEDTINKELLNKPEHIYPKKDFIFK